MSLNGLRSQRRFNVMAMIHERSPMVRQQLELHIAQLDSDILRLQDLEELTDWEDAPTKEYPAHFIASMTALGRVLP